MCAIGRDNSNEKSDINFIGISPGTPADFLFIVLIIFSIFVELIFGGAIFGGPEYSGKSESITGL